jgi:hypothetical protein
MGIDAFFLTVIRKEKEIKINNNDIKENNNDIKENNNEIKNIKGLLSPKTKEVIKRNKSMENFMKFSWGWTN